LLQRDIEAGIHQNARTVRVGQREYAPHQFAQITRVQILLAYLNPFYASRKRAFYKMEQCFGAPGGVPVGDVIAQHHAGS